MQGVLPTVKASSVNDANKLVRFNHTVEFCRVPSRQTMLGYYSQWGDQTYANTYMTFKKS